MKNLFNITRYVNMYISRIKLLKESYYFIQTQEVCPQEEWDQFIISLKSDLPATFRITGSKGEAKRMLEIIQGQFITECLNQNDTETTEQATIFPLPW